MSALAAFIIAILVILVIVGIRHIVVVPADSAYIVERLGMYHRTLTPGLHGLAPFVDRVAHRFSLLPKSDRFSDQCITRDNVCVEVTSSHQWQIVDSRRAAYATPAESNFIVSLIRSSQRAWISQRNWDEVRETTREMQQAILRATAEGAHSVGAKILAFDVERIERV